MQAWNNPEASLKVKLICAECLTSIEKLYEDHNLNNQSTVVGGYLGNWGRIHTGRLPCNYSWVPRLILRRNRSLVRYVTCPLILSVALKPSLPYHYRLLQVAR